jgi:polyphosphate kinase 2 (PPK2 family)
MILNKKNNKCELLRFCNKFNINIIDSATKLLKYFINISTE